MPRMPPPPMFRMDAQPIDQGGRSPLRPEQYAHRLFSFEGHHAAAAPEVEVAHQPLEAFVVERRLALVLWAATAFKGGDQEGPVVGAAETVRRHSGEPARLTPRRPARGAVRRGGPGGRRASRPR